ncbi:MAG: sensor histidine kinase [Candidatus Heimdallarchaeaceae archaeon]
MNIVKRSIFGKILLLMVMVSVISGTLLLSISLIEQTSAMEENIIQHHIALADVASQSIESGYLIQRWPFGTLKEISEGEGVLFWWIVKPNGEILLADDTSMWGKQMNEQSLGTSKTIVKDSVFYETGENIKLIVHPLNIREEGEQWTFYLGVSLEPVIVARNEMIVGGVSCFFVTIIAIVFVSVYFTKNITRPIVELTEGARAISRGNLDYKIKIKSEDEIGRLSDAFNKMTGDLKKSRSELESYSENLEKEVEERTKELNEKVVKLKASESANLSILKDLNNTIANLEKAEGEIKEKNLELKANADNLLIVNQELNVAKEQLYTLNQDLELNVQERTAEIEVLLKQKDEFVNQLGHDLKNPLGPIVNLLPLVEEQETNLESKEMLEVINRNAKYMKNLVTKTIELARLNAPSINLSFKDTTLLDEINAVIEKNELFFKENNIKVESKINEDIVVKADKLRLSELFDNLIGNSVKYSPNGGNITIDAKDDGKFVTVSIRDEGMGMTGEQLDHIFEEFYKADQARHDFDSSGLGTAICKRIVERHGGKIWAESPGSGKGTTMFFTLPLSNKKTSRTNHNSKDN